MKKVIKIVAISTIVTGIVAGLYTLFSLKAIGPFVVGINKENEKYQ